MSKPSACVSLLALVALLALLLASSAMPASGDGMPTALPPGELWTATPGATDTPLARPTWIVTPSPMSTARARVFLPYVEK